MNETACSMSMRGRQTAFGYARAFLAACSVLLLAACQTTGAEGVSNFDVFGKPQKFVPGVDVVLPRNSKALSHNTGVVSTIRVAMELDQQKRFEEARHLLSQVRRAQPVDSKAYRSITNSMAVLALKEGEFETFRRLARQLDTSLGNPVRVKAPHLEIITLYRAVTGKKLPVNAPEKMKMLKDKYPKIQSAKLQRKAK